jgi:hypothetical protein
VGWHVSAATTAFDGVQCVTQLTTGLEIYAFRCDLGQRDCRVGYR